MINVHAKTAQRNRRSLPSVILMEEMTLPLPMVTNLIDHPSYLLRENPVNMFHLGIPNQISKFPAWARHIEGASSVDDEFILGLQSLPDSTSAEGIEQYFFEFIKSHRVDQTRSDSHIDDNNTENPTKSTGKKKKSRQKRLDFKVSKWRPSAKIITILVERIFADKDIYPRDILVKLVRQRDINLTKLPNQFIQKLVDRDDWVYN